MKVKRFEIDDLDKLIAFEKELRKEEPDTYFTQINEDYKRQIVSSFSDPSFNTALSYIALIDDKVIGRLDASLIVTRYNGLIESAYLDWIAVLKSQRRKGVAQLMVKALLSDLKKKGITELIVLTATNEEAKHFYDRLAGNDREEAIRVEIS